jgi:hypothetical protein
LRRVISPETEDIAFVWHNTQFVGWTTAGSVTLPTLSAVRDGFAVTYYTWPVSVPFANYTPQTANHRMTVTYYWSNGHLQSSYNGYRVIGEMMSLKPVE